MTDHRLLQRALFRMQVDPAFARRILAGDAEAIDSAGLRETDASLLREVHPAGLRADPGGRRRAQVLGNVASEFVLSLAAAVSGAFPAALEQFATSAEFHGAVSGNRPLPFAFAAFFAAAATERGEAGLGALVRLEEAMARARRGERSRAEPAPREVVLAPSARLVELPAGTWALAERLRAALDRGAQPERPPARVAAATEAVLVQSRAADRRLREVSGELLEPAVARLLSLAERPLGEGALELLAREEDVPPREIIDFVESLVAEGVLRRG